jgi:copper chaperone CopZ
MTTHELFVENIKCNGCIDSIKNALQNVHGVTNVEVSKEDGKVSVTAIALGKNEIATILASAGYPEKGHNSFLKKAKTFVQCTLTKTT